MSARNAYRNIVINTFSASLLMPRHLRWALLRLYGVDLARASVAAGCFFGGAEVSIGEGTYINHGVFFDASGPIRIGRKVHIGMRVCIVTGTHSLGPSSQRAGALESAPVTIGDGCWIGAGAMIMPGVEIGAGSVIAAGSVVTGDCQPNAVYAGVPARKVRDLTDDPVSK